MDIFDISNVYSYSQKFLNDFKRGSPFYLDNLDNKLINLMLRDMIIFNFIVENSKLKFFDTPKRRLRGKYDKKLIPVVQYVIELLLRKKCGDDLIFCMKTLEIMGNLALSNIHPSLTCKVSP